MLFMSATRPVLRVTGERTGEAGARVLYVIATACSLCGYVNVRGEGSAPTDEGHSG